MTIFSKESLELLRQKIDLIEVLSPYVQFSKSGSYYKAVCPFHQEKTPSFVIQRGDRHYHCFGCGAHGDAITFLMQELSMSFVEAVESLAEKFHIQLEYVQDHQKVKGPSKQQLKEILEKSARFYHGLLLHTKEGHTALTYLYKRGIDLDFIKTFQIGFALSRMDLLQKALSKYPKQLLFDAGLIAASGRDFFIGRIMIPIRDALGAVIGFSARKLKEASFGPKYINTSETALFKKSNILFGLSYCRKRIAKERCAIVVEGQFDALRLIYAGFNFTVAGQGTAFGQSHVQELLNLGVKKVYLALDSDEAGINATVKIGDLLQKEAIEVLVVNLGQNSDPDQIIIESGPKYWMHLLETCDDYLSFLAKALSSKINIQTPSGKNEWVQALVTRVKGWNHPLMVHESLRKIAQITKTPESMIGIDKGWTPNVYLTESTSKTFSTINPDHILEADLLRWLFLLGDNCPKLFLLAKQNIDETFFTSKAAKNLYEKCLERQKEQTSVDLLSFAIDANSTEEQEFFNEMLKKKINPEKAEESFIQTLQKILDQKWMQKREAIKNKIHSGTLSDDEAISMAKEFDLLKKNRPTIKNPQNISLEDNISLS